MLHGAFVACIGNGGGDMKQIIPYGPGPRYYLSICGAEGFLGVGIAEAKTPEKALAKIEGVPNDWEEILALTVPEDEWSKVPDASKNRLLSKEDVKQIWPESKTLREWNES